MNEPRPTRQPREFTCSLPGVKITKEQEERLLAHCRETRRNMSEVVRDALAMYLQGAPPR